MLDRLARGPGDFAAFAAPLGPQFLEESQVLSSRAWQHATMSGLQTQHGLQPKAASKQPADPLAVLVLRLSRGARLRFSPLRGATWGAIGRGQRFRAVRKRCVAGRLRGQVSRAFSALTQVLWQVHGKSKSWECSGFVSLTLPLGLDGVPERSQPHLGWSGS